MRNKVVKKLRRLARQWTVGAPLVKYIREDEESPILLHPKCTRFVYKRLKASR